MPDPTSPQAERGWLELFYDLVFVAAILILSSAFSHNHDVGEGIWFVGAFVGVWWVWLATTLHANRFPDDDLGYRIVALIQMFFVAMVAIGASDGSQSNPEFVSFCYAALTLSIAFTFLRHPGLGARGSFARGRIVEYLVATALFVVAAPLPEEPRIILWVLGLAVTILPAVAHCRKAPPLEESHLIERLAALTIIMCGEAFVKVALTADTDGFDHLDVLAVGLEFVIVFAIWSSYFDDIPVAGVAARAQDRAAWLGAHLLFHLGIVGVAIGVSRFLVLNPDNDIPTDDVAAVALPMAAVYLGLIAISAVSRRRPLGRLVRARLGAVVAVAVIVVLAEWANWFDTYWSVACFAVVAVGAAVVEARARSGTTVLAAA
jgi:low temperature requirement protein LtrA